jgi:hypothetical protein
MILITRISQNPNYLARTNQVTRTPTPTRLRQRLLHHRWRDLVGGAEGELRSGGQGRRRSRGKGGVGAEEQCHRRRLCAPHRRTRDRTKIGQRRPPSPSLSLDLARARDLRGRGQSASPRSPQAGGVLEVHRRRNLGFGRREADQAG